MSKSVRNDLADFVDIEWLGQIGVFRFFDKGQGIMVDGITGNKNDTGSLFWFDLFNPAIQGHAVAVRQADIKQYGMVIIFMDVVYPVFTS